MKEKLLSEFFDYFEICCDIYVTADVLCDNTSINTALLPRPKWAFTPLGKDRGTSGKSTPPFRL